MTQKKYMNPYLGGALLGLVLVAAFWVSGRGLGASGAQPGSTPLPRPSTNTLSNDHRWAGRNGPLTI